VHELLKAWPGEVLRYVLLSAHYRQPLDWSDKVLEQAQATLDRLYGLLRDHDRGESIDVDPDVLEALEDDLNTPTALAALNQIARRISAAETGAEAAACLRVSGQLLGLLQHAPAEWFSGRQVDTALSEAEIESLIEARKAARARRDFAAADRIRDDLAERGIVLKDRPDGTSWEIAKK
jgi:cysteinyl-tRNA synthetase